MHDSCALGPKFVKFPVKSPKEEFVLWMGLCGHDVGQRGKLSPAIEAAWLQCQKQPFRFRLTHFDHDDIVCGCSPPEAASCGPAGVRTGQCPTARLTTSLQTMHRDSRTNVRLSAGQAIPPPRPTMKPGPPGGHSHGPQSHFPACHSLPLGMIYIKKSGLQENDSMAHG